MGFVIGTALGAGEGRRQQLLARHGSARSVAVPAEDRPMALHTANPRACRPSRRDRPIQGPGRAAVPIGPIYGQLQRARGGHARVGTQDIPAGSLQAPIIVTFHAPPDPTYEFREFYSRVRDRGFILYPGKLRTVETFRVGCIGAIESGAMRQAVAAVAAVLREMGVKLHVGQTHTA